MYKYFKIIGNADHISKWKSKGFSDENIKPPIHLTIVLLQS